jgi:hypothetical protein
VSAPSAYEIGLGFMVMRPRADLTVTN